MCAAYNPDNSPICPGAGRRGAPSARAEPIVTPTFLYHFLPLPPEEFPPIIRLTIRGAQKDYKCYLGESYEGFPGVESHVHPYLVVWKAGQAICKNLALDARERGEFSGKQLCLARNIDPAEKEQINEICDRWTQLLADQSDASTVTNPSDSTSHAAQSSTEANSSSDTQ